MNKNFYEPRQQIFIEKNIIAPFFNQSCADVMVKSAQWFANSDIDDETVQNSIDVSKSTIICAANFIIEQILRINTEHQKTNQGDLIFYRPSEFWVLDRISDTNAEMCGIYKESGHLIKNKDFLTKFGESYLKSLYRDFHELSYAKKNSKDAEIHLYSLFLIFLDIYRSGVSS